MSLDTFNEDWSDDHKSGVIAVVGRPNVGKSSIFNWLAGRRLAIVDSVAGVTRDRMKFILEMEKRYFEIVDTGGIGINDVDELDEEHPVAIARSYADAPEIDGNVFVEDIDKTQIQAGQLLTVEITDADEYDLFAKLVTV